MIDLSQMSAIENPPTHKGSGYRVFSFTNWHALRPRVELQTPAEITN